MLNAPRSDARRRVVVADADAALRSQISTLLDGTEFDVCAGAGDAESAIRAVDVHGPDVALVELRLPGNGLRVAAKIATRVPALPIVMMASDGDEADVVTALRIGSSGYVSKDGDLARLPHSLRAALAGEIVLPRTMVRQVVEQLRRREPTGRLRLTDDGAVRLTEREWDVLVLLREGRTTAEIAARLFVSQVTVRSHIATCVKKLGVPDRDAAVMALAGIDSAEDLLLGSGRP